MSNTTRLGLGGGYQKPFTTPVSSQCARAVANSDATAAQSATELKLPTSVSGTAFRWLAVGPGVTRVELRLRFPVGTTSVTTSPVVRLLGAIITDGGLTVPSSTTGDLSGTGVEFRRLDTTTETASGVPLTAFVPGSTAGLRDATYAYSNPSDQFDVRGCHYIGVMVETAASVSGGSGTPDILVYGYN